MLNVKVLQTKKGLQINVNLLSLGLRGSNPDSSRPKRDVLPVTPKPNVKWRLINYWTGAQT